MTEEAARQRAIRNIAIRNHRREEGPYSDDSDDDSDTDENQPIQRQRIPTPPSSDSDDDIDIDDYFNSYTQMSYIRSR
ncbi:hypothetical protein TRFO_29950 [Tritrichomonas foetus]|uniref:Uncharacterized protein n=1 Tax=Tritrichomonas foetus TaxID=1144522 RepID=A0A1J4JZY1_9EUKA|nr:hypothetical protein TRFO_29950 [Tritrichomonas foetus]|eukprot:OHT02813.1 hypothetical protein TRFO_29950 [Tritrichomonas foetus]